MPILALPKSTVQLLGSTQVLTTPTSLVKELIENALDANATSIDILISKNTLDKLEVRDNGHGIPSDDFDVLGKRGHTSKLRTFEELKLVGGTSLGFRGEALASAVQLGEVYVTTKTEGESVAIRLALKAPGVVDKKTRTSHPVGTTVSVQNFMDKIPVRKKNFEKDASKTLAKINQLLRSYALARPSIRFNLKVTGVGKACFSFAPRPHSGIKEAISLVIGRDATLECIEKVLLSAEDGTTAIIPDHDNIGVDEDVHVDNGCFSIEAFLPKPGADPSKVGTGHYLSIDSRPVSHEKGTMKKVINLFKAYLRAGLANSSEEIRNPFIRLNIICPVASYDANVEPAKDEVLFENEAAVLDLIEKLFKAVYGDLKAVPVIFSSKSLHKGANNLNMLLASNLDVGEMLSKDTVIDPVPVLETLAPPLQADIQLQRSHSSSPLLHQRISENASNTLESLAIESDNSIDKRPISARRQWQFSMSNDFDQEVDDGFQKGQRKSNSRSSRQQTSDPDVSKELLNPWVIAKMVSPISHDPDSPRPKSPFIQLFPDNSRPFRTPIGPLDASNKFAPPTRRPRQISESNAVRDLQPLDPRRHSASSVHPQAEEAPLFIGDVLPTPPRRRNDFVTAKNIAENCLVSPPQTDPKVYPKSRGPNRPFISPLVRMESRATQPDRSVQITPLGNDQRPQRQSDCSSVMLLDKSRADLAWAMDFEQRKEAATRRRREELRALEIRDELHTSSVPERSSPHKNRYNAAIAMLEGGQLQTNSMNEPAQRGLPFKTCLPDGDPRAYLMRRQKSSAARNHTPGRSTLMRAKSTRLPLEVIPPQQYVHRLIYHMSVNMGKLRDKVKVLANEDVYIRSGGEFSGLNIKETEIPMLEKKLQDAVNVWMESGGDNNYEVEYNVGNASDI